MAIPALFDINDDGEDRGYQAANSEVLSLTLRDPSQASTVLFQVWNPAGPDPELGIAANPPRASGGAPILNLATGTQGGQAVMPGDVTDPVTVVMPGSGSHSWIVRCVVNGGQRTLGNGRVVTDPALIYERGVWIPTGYDTRKIIATESQQFSVEGWADAINAMIEAGVSPGIYTPPGTGAVVRAVVDWLSDDVLATNFMTAAEKAAAYDATFALDHQPAIQKALDHALYKNAFGIAAGQRVRLPGGVLRINSTIHVGYGTDFRSIELVGQGKREGGTYESGGCGTVIRAFFNQGPAIAIQGARSTVVRGMTIMGVNADVCFNACFGPASMAHVEASGWVDPSLPAASSSRYSPYAGIAIDPYTGPVPTPSYPAVSYPAFLGGGTPQYEKGQSRDVLIEDVRISGFVAGIAQQPGDADGNGDFTKVSRVSFFFCTYGFTWGNSQARAQVIEHCIFAGLHTGFASSVHGKQMGNPLITATDCAFETMIQIFEEMNLGFGVGPLLEGCFAEAIYKIGKCNGVSQNAGSLKFLNTELGFSWWARYGVPTWVLEMEGSMQARFENVFFYLSGAGKGVLNFRCTGSSIDNMPAQQLAFEGCQTQGDAWTGGLYEKAAHNATLGITVSGGSRSVERFSCRTGYLRNLTTGNLLGTGVLYTERAIAPRHLLAPVYAKRLKSLVGDNDPGVEVAWQSFNFSITSVTSTVGRVVTLVIDSLTTQALMHFGGDVGDYMVSGATGACFVVKSRTGTTLVLEAVSGYDKDGNLLSGIIATGIMSPIHNRRYAIPAVLYGDTTAGNPTVANLTLGNGGTPTLADILTADDYLYVDQEVDQIINPFDGSARLVSFNQGARTMTFQGNFNYSQTRRRFAIFVRPAFPNA